MRSNKNLWILPVFACGHQELENRCDFSVLLGIFLGRKLDVKEWRVIINDNGDYRVAFNNRSRNFVVFFTFIFVPTLKRNKTVSHALGINSS